MEPVLLILAAGMGSRYGGMKQIDAIGPSGETIMDYSIYDAKRAGIKKIVFVISRSAEKEFNEAIIKRYSGKTNIDYVIQDLSKTPAGISFNAVRVKPWGTGQAVLMGAEKIKEPFIVINADDFYGFDSFRVLTDYLVSLPADRQTEYGLAGFTLLNTLSENGSVSRAICEEDGRHFLKTITERFNIKRVRGVITFSENDMETPVDGNSITSLNMWGFTPSLFPRLKEKFEAFLINNHESTGNEFLLPACIDELIKSNLAKVKIIKSNAEWFGLTYKEDKPYVVNRINQLIAAGDYPGNLF